MDTAFCDLIALDPVNQWIESHTDMTNGIMGDGRLLSPAFPTENSTEDDVRMVVDGAVRTVISDEQYGNEVAEMFGSYTINDEPPKLDELSLSSNNNCGVQFPVGEHLSKCGAKCKRSMPKIEHKCDICNRIYSTRQYLIQHISAVHLGERRFCCEYCGAKFGAPGTLGRHRNMVHLNKIFYCHYEGCVHPGFKCSKALKAHIHAIHTHERPYSCSFCGRGFVRRNDMNFHEKRHLRANSMQYRWAQFLAISNPKKSRKSLQISPL